MHLCNRCNRQLKTDKSIALGYGPTCHKKHLQEQADAEFNKNQMTIDEVIVNGSTENFTLSR